MSDSLNFEQKIPISAMTEQRMHILVLKHHLLDMRRAARFQYSNLNQNTADIYKIVKDVNKITTSGLFRLTKDSINYDNPVPGPGKLPDLDYAFLYVIPFTDTRNYIRQYTLIASEGYSSIRTRLGFYIDSKLHWGKWRPYSDSNPMYELLQTTDAKVNETYLSFGNHELILPDPVLCSVGDVIRLDQWKNSGIVTQKEWFTDSENRRNRRIVKQINTYPAVIGVSKKMKCTGLAEDPVIFEHKADALWTSNLFTISIKMINDKYYWIISNNNEIVYKSEEPVSEKTSPSSAHYRFYTGEQELVNLQFESICTSDNSKDIWSCNTYEFEVFNDRDINNKHYNYWCVFISNTVKDAHKKLHEFYEESFNRVYREFDSTHARITNESRILTEYIDTKISEVMNQHNDDILRLSNAILKYHPNAFGPTTTNP